MKMLPNAGYLCKCYLRWMLTFDAIAVIRASSSLYLFFSFLTSDSTALLTNPSVSMPCWCNAVCQIRCCTMTGNGSAAHGIRGGYEIVKADNSGELCGVPFILGMQKYAGWQWGSIWWSMASIGKHFMHFDGILGCSIPASAWKRIVEMVGYMALGV